MRWTTWSAIALLALTFALGAWRTFQREVASDDDLVIIRYAHFQGMPSLVAAIDEAMRAYEAINPRVRLEQILVPDRVWRPWLQAQMSGGSPPDLVEVVAGMQVEFLARYYTPLSSWVEEPNPYNEGTPLAGVPWRDTFVEGLTSSPSYNYSLGHVMGVPKSAVIVRVLYNRELYREIAGDEPLPSDYAAFLDLCERANAWARARNRPFSPLAVSKFNVSHTLYGLFAGQTQRLALAINPMHNLRVGPRQVAVEYLRGTWSLRDPPVQDGLAIMRELGRQLTPGFLQLERDDALFQFTQGRALMLAIGSFAAVTTMQEAPFEVGVFRLPLPAPNDPRYGPNVIGLASEAERGLEGPIGLSRASRYPEVAIDFLRFLTSAEGAVRFTARSQFVPAIVGVPPPPAIQEFSVQLDGPPDGFTIDFAALANREANRHFSNLLHLLVRPDGSVAAFTEEYERRLRTALQRDVNSEHRALRRSLQRSDGLWAAYHLGAPPNTRDADTAAALLESIHQQETQALQLYWTLNQAPQP
jgi:raffinose/stachyose/melibiose transport system substrate-binding protein